MPNDSSGAQATAAGGDVDLARMMYDPTKVYHASLKDNVNRLRDEGDYTEAAAAHHVDSMSEAFADADGMDLEGIVSKRADSP